MQGAGLWLAYIVVGLLCLAGLALSCVSLSGTWLVVAASILAALVRSDPFPGIWTVVLFAAAAGAVEGVEAVAGAWGVKRRGGSNLAGLAAMLGGFAGLLVGGLIPIPVVGSLLGMLVCSFALAYVVERRRLRAERAADIAWGAVTARVLVILLKVVVTLGLTAILCFGMILG
jgi:uncharacterized protein YqgC (DUF456 family)